MNVLVVGVDGHLARLGVVDAGDREQLAAGEPERLRVLAVGILEREHAHHQQVRAVDPLVALGDHRADAEQLRALRRPVARGARAVLLAGQHDQRRALGAVALGDVEDRALLAARHVHGPRALAAGHEQVAQAHVRERPAHHHLVVAAAGAVRVELAALDAVLDQVVPGRAVRLDRAGRRDVVGRDRVAEHARGSVRRETSSTVRRLERHPLEVRRPADVGRARVPGVEIAGGRVERAPGLVAGEDVRVAAAEELAGDRAGDRRSEISSEVGQSSWRKTSLPSGSWPIGSVVRSRSIRPASAYATTSGGEAR